MTIYLVTVGDTRYHHAPHVRAFTDLTAAQTYALESASELDLDVGEDVPSGDWEVRHISYEGVTYVRFTINQ